MSSQSVEEEEGEEVGLMGKQVVVGFEADEDDPNFSTSSPSFKFRYDVFLSFRGEDTRHGFTEDLYNKLKEKGIRTFRGEEGLETGDEIPESLLTAIEDSATSVAVISPNYAESRWCLEELSKILDSRRLLFPVFYKVDPSHVRHLKGTFEDHFRAHEQELGQDSVKVLRWKKAMEKAGGIAGWDSKNWEEPALIQSLVKKILTKLSNTPLSVAKHPIGINSRVEQVLKMLNVKSNGVEAIGFHGMGGIGKTTLAKAVYNNIVTQFQHRSFISDVREVSKKSNGLTSLQELLIRNLFPDDTSSSVDEVVRGIMLIKQRIHEKKVLIVLDDVDDVSQLDALAGSKDWFHEGSRIIITTRDSNVLSQNLVNKMYEVKELNPAESLQLFSYHAFSREKPTEDFMKLSEQVVTLTGQLPLALEVLGTFLFDKRRIKEWEDALEKLKLIRPRNLHDILMISFNALNEQQKCIFLDIACFFVGMDMERENAIDILKGCGFNAEIAITVLTARSLVKTVDNKLRMHDQLRDMGRQLVLEESPRDAGMRTRLWNHDEIMTVLRYERGTRTIQGMILSLGKNNMPSPSRSQVLNQRNSVLSCILANLKNIFGLGSEIETEEVHVHTKPFAAMSNLRLLQINHLKLEGTFKFIPGELKWLEWKNCPLEALPSDFCPSELAVLDLSKSKIKQVWAQSWWIWWHRYKMAEKLIVLNLSGCYNLTATPDFSGHPCLEKLNLELCTGLVEIHKSIGDVRTLRTLNLKDCSNLVEFPNDISGLMNLENFVLSGCSKLKELPRDLSSLESLLNLLADGTAIRKLPDSISRLKRLESLSLNRCTSLKQLPNSIGQLRSLTELSLNDSAIEAIPDSIGNLINLEILSIIRCTSITTIPDSIGNLKSLVELLLDGNTFKDLPDSMFLLPRLKHLSLGSCRSLIQLPASIGGLVSLVELCMDKISITELPDEIRNLTILEKLEMRDCELLSRLPDSIGSMSSLTTFLLMNAKITELPESIGLLKKLEVLNVNNCKRLSRLPASFGELESLRVLRMERTAVTYLPKEFGMLSRLMVLKMGKRSHPRDIEDHTKMSLLNKKEDPKLVVLPDEFSNLSLLYELDASYCKISGIIPDAFEKLSSLEDLKLNHNNFCRLPSSLGGLILLKQLSLSHCTELKLLPPLPSSLDFLDVTNCTALESISDLSNLVNLLEMRLTNCKKVTDIPGLECLSLLNRLYLGGCNACFTSIRGRLHKVALKRLRNLCVPGSEIPNWLIQEVPSYLRPRNREIKGVIICVVISLQQQQFPDDLRSELPAIVDIQAKIIRNNIPIFTTTLYLMGVPDTSDDQIYLCRYVHFNPLVSLLKEGDSIQVAMRNPPVFQGLHLKKYGINLVFEDDDDIDDDDETMDETELSVTGRLANYVGAVA